MGPMIGVAAELWTQQQIQVQAPSTSHASRCSGLHTKPWLYRTPQDELEQRTPARPPFPRLVAHIRPDLPEEKKARRTSTDCKLRVSSGNV